MKKSTIFKLLFSAIMLFATAAFTSCVDDNEDNGIAYLEVKPDVLAASLAGETLTLEILTNRQWEIQVPQEANSWIRPEMLSGDGDAKVPVQIFGSAVGRRSQITVVLKNKYDTYKKATVTVIQGEVAPEVLIYNETAGTKAVANPWPSAANYDGWITTGEGAEAVTYAGNATIRNSGLSNVGGYDGASGPNVIFFGTMPVDFIVKNIALESSQTNLMLNFGGSYSLRDEATGSYDNIFKTDKFLVSLSADGVTWVPITYTINEGDKTTPYWIYATANFSLKNPVSALYVRFQAEVASAFRLDDISLKTGFGGQEVDLATGGVLVTTNTPTDITETGATFSGAVSSTEGVTAVGFQYMVSTSTDWSTATKVTADAVASPFTKAVTGLTSGTAYTVRAYATTADGDVYGVPTTFTAAAVFYHTNVGTKSVANPYPLVSAYDDWQATGTGISGVTYTADGTISVRSSGLANTGAYDGASGPNVVFFGTFASGATSNAFMINNITVPSSQTKMQLTFGASRSVNNNGTYDNTFKTENFLVSLSSDGTNWTPITYTINNGDQATPFWVLATSDFTLKSGVSKIYIKFSATEASVIRLDDVTLAPSTTGGQEVDLGGTAPSITLNPTSLSFTADADNTGKTVAVTVANQGANILYAESSDNTQFPTTLSGTTVTVKALANATATAKTATVKVYLAAGPGMTHIAEQTIAITQAVAGAPGDPFYHTTVGTQAVSSPYPLVSDYTDWKATGTGIANVTYTADGTISVRASGKANTGAYDGASGPNVVFFGTFASGATSNAFMINNITVPSSQTKMQLNFGGSYSMQSGGSYDNIWKSDKFIVSLSSDGTTWTPITYTVNNGDQTDPYWVFATSAFTLKSGVSKIYIKFSASVASVFRLDDVTLAPSTTGGQEVDLGGGSTAPSITVDPTSLSFTADADNAGKTVAVTVANQGANILYAESSDNTQFPTTLSGTTVTVKAAANTTSTAKTATVKVYLAAGPGMTHVAEQTIAVSQAAAGASTNDFFHTTVGTQAVSNPYPLVSNYTDWQATGTGISGVTYTADGTISVRASGKANTGAYNGASGPNVVFFGTFASGATSNAFMINNITVPSSQTKMQLTFGGSYSLQSGGSYDNIWKSDKFIVSLSSDGTTWTPITYTVNNGDQTDPFWIFATSGFTLKSGVSKIYLKFSASVASVFRLDDISLSPSTTGGQEVDLGGGGVTTPSITLNPTSLSFTANADNTGKTVGVTVANQGVNILYAESSDNTQFPTTLSGTTVTVKAAANTTAQQKTATVKVYLALGPGMTHLAEQSVAITQAAAGVPPTPGATTVTFSSADIATPSLPTSKTTGSASYTIDGKTYVIFADAAASGSYYWIDNSKYPPVVEPSKGLYLKAGYLEMPAVAGKKLTAVTLTSTSNMGGGVKLAINDTSNQTVVGAEDFAKGTPLTIGLDGATNTAYRLQVVAGNAQIATMELIYSDGGGSTTPNITGVNPTSLSWAATATNAQTVAVSGTAIEGKLTTSFSGSAFTASVSGTTVTVTPKAANTGTTDITETLTIAATGGNSTTVTLTQSKPVASAPNITAVNPTSLTWDADGVNAQTIAVSGTDISGKLTTSSTGSAFNIAVSGTTVTVTPKAANSSTTTDVTETLTIAATGGNSKTVSLTQSKKSASGTPTLISLDFTKPINATPALPTSKQPTAPGVVSHVIDGNTWTINGAEAYYMMGSTALLFGKIEAYIEVPAVVGKKLTKIDFRTPSGSSSKVTVGIKDKNAAAVSGGEDQKLAAAASFTFNLTGTQANTSYRIVVTNANNAQFATLTLQYE